MQPTLANAEPQPEEARHLLERAELARLSQAMPARLLWAAVSEWALIAAAVAVSLWVDHVASTVLAVAFIATRQHALLVLMHDFSHRQFSRTRPLLNDALGNFLTAIPFFITIHGFRRDHAAHHAHTGGRGDSMWELSRGKDRYTFPKSRPKMAWILFKCCVGAYTVNELKGYVFNSGMGVDCPWPTRLQQACFAIAAIGATAYLGAWKVVAVYWLLPLFTGVIALLYFREVGEHFGLPPGGKSPTRTMILGRLEAWLIAPHHINYHAEHHQYPSVPALRLPALHALLQRQPSFVRRTVFTKGYAGLLRELSGQDGSTARR